MYLTFIMNYIASQQVLPLMNQGINYDASRTLGRPAGRPAANNYPWNEFP